MGKISRTKRGITPEGQISSQRRLPIELEMHFSKTSRGPEHFHRPPSERTDITQIKKFRQCVFVKTDFRLYQTNQNL
jgi:hypothetical protein